jgi:hypothetical protein
MNIDFLKNDLILLEQVRQDLIAKGWEKTGSVEKRQVNDGSKNYGTVYELKGNDYKVFLNIETAYKVSKYLEKQ